MDLLYSIQAADRFFDTASKPVLITCNDMNDYVCKYSGAIGPSLRLVCEYTGAFFLKLWGLDVPDYNLIKISRQHLPSEWKINPIVFDKTCFGSKYNRGFADVTKLNESSPYASRKKYPQSEDLLKIALFDLWISNEDRNHINYNLLIDTESERNFIPIDHDKIFNSRDFTHPIYEIAEDESLINTPLFPNMINNQTFTRSFYTEYEEYFYFCTNKCRASLVELHEGIPDDWEIDKLTFSEKMDQIFSERWLKSTFTTYITFLQYYLNKVKS